MFIYLFAHQCKDHTLAYFEQEQEGYEINTSVLRSMHVSGICSTCFYWLRQIHRIRQSLDTESATTLLHTFIASRVNYCNTVLAGSPRFITDWLQHVLNAAARVITGMQKFDRGLSDLLHSELHWQDIHQRVQYKLGVAIYRRLQNRAPQYLVDCCVHMSDVSSRQRLRSAGCATTPLQQVQTSIILHCSSDAALMVWNSFPDSSGHNAEHRQLQIGIKDSPVHGACDT